ncbi:hypothetical protein IFR04_007853 [Cadophora malorum]|uniref:Methyltransferase n=1 Tax=Cadophora malorum TaxID=108018 RepID=A0A8H7W893_9HELO|nr:hypothetical protein IFR04_007853 [Cadophora malorum]
MIAPSEDFITTEVLYLVRDPRYHEEKPYAIAYDAGGMIPQTNMTNESFPIQIQNVRNLQVPNSFDDFGFAVAKLDDKWTAAQFRDEIIVKERFYPQVERILKKQFPDAIAVRVIEHNLRKRDMRFSGTEEISETVQPATCVHADYSLEAAEKTARAFYKDVEFGRLATINFWTSFQGPGNDWPLALCDYRTIDYDTEAIAADRVYHNRFTENQRYYHSPEHKWFYVKDLGADEVLMFRQTDSSLEGGGSVAHTSFNNPKADSDAAPRESIELRAFVFFK